MYWLKIFDPQPLILLTKIILIMKKNRINLKNVAMLIACFAVSIMLVFTGCKKDDDKKPGPPPDPGGGGNTSLTGIKFEKAEVSVKKGSTLNLVLLPVPSNATLPKCSYESDDEDIATVNSTGKVTAVAVGETVITATTNDGKFTAECTIKVTTNGGGGEGDLTYRDPYLKFGSAQSAVKSYETRELYNENEEELAYHGENADVKSVYYGFESKKLFYVVIILSESSNIETRAKTFLSNKYDYQGLNDYNEHVFLSKDGKTIIYLYYYDGEDMKCWVVDYEDNSAKKGTRAIKKSIHSRF